MKRKIAAGGVNVTLTLVAATKKHSGVSIMRFCVSKWSALLTAAVVASSIASIAQAATVTDTSLVAPGVYFGNGNAGTNVHWTVNTQDNVELGLVAIQRGVGANITPTGSTYNVPTGADPTNSNRAYWNFDFSINVRAGGPSSGTLT